MSILYPNFKKLGDSGKFGRQNGVGCVLDALDYMVDIRGDVHAKRAWTLLLVIYGLKTEFLHAIGCMNYKTKLFVQRSVIFLEILVNQRYNLNLAQILFVVRHIYSKINHVRLPSHLTAVEDS